MNDAEANPDAPPTPAATVRDVTEATGATEAEVEAHARQIRAEAAFREPKTDRPSALPWIAMGALVVALGVTWKRLHPEPPAVEAAAWPTATSVVTTVIRPRTTRSLTIDMTERGAVRPPPGFRVAAIGQRTELADEDYEANKRALPYERTLDALAGCAEGQVAALDRREGPSPTPDPTPIGAEYGVFSPRPGYARLSISGWTGRRADWIALPLDDAGRRRARDLAVRVLADAKDEQDAALRPVADPRTGVVGPPPGFAVRFAGRRLDVQRGPRISFSGIPRTVVASRLEAALLNAAYRDRRPPVGAWSGDAVQEAKIPLPALSRVEIEGPDGLVAADLPTRRGDEEATRQAARALAGKAAAQIEKVNAKGLENDAKDP